MKALVMGIDVGTQGVRSLVTDLQGNCLASKSIPFSTLNISPIENHKEQEPHQWWSAAVQSITSCMQTLVLGGHTPEEIQAISVDATSGTVLALDEANNPISHGIMYNDARSQEEVKQIAAHCGPLEKALGYGVNASFGLPKILWLQKHLGKKITSYVHQQDYIMGKLSGEYHVTDYSNALKSCYDLVNQKWPDFLGQLGIDTPSLPKVVAPGTVIGTIQRETAALTGLSTQTKVVAGATDGYASALSAGISGCGDWASIIGTTLVMKGIGKDLVNDKHGRLYSHLHPQGYWLLGGASNVGGRCLNENFDKNLFDDYNRAAEMRTPTSLASYPLLGRGERYPFVRPQAQGFLLGDNLDDNQRYTAMIEGVGYVERLCFEMVESLGCEVGDEIFTAGGACKSDVWLQIRSNILGKVLKVPEQTDAVMGTALLASLATTYDTLEQASHNMIKIQKTICPSNLCGQYEEGYLKTKEELQKRGYLD